MIAQPIEMIGLLILPGGVSDRNQWRRDIKLIGALEEAARELEAKGANGRRLSVHDIIRGWARLHADQFDRPPDYMGMYRMAPTFADLLRSLQRVAY